MKQFLTVAAVGVLGAFLLVACGEKKPAEAPAGGTEPAATETAPAASPTGEGAGGEGTAAPAESAAPAST